MKEPATLSYDIHDADEKSAEQSPAYFSPTSEASSPLLGESTTQHSSGLLETCVPASPRERYQSSESDAEEGVEQTHEDLLEPPNTVQGGVHAMPAITASTPLSLQCMVCGAPPTVGSRPTVTLCGHLFCSRYVLRTIAARKPGSQCTRCITRHVMASSECPVCESALLLYCLFKLNLSVSS